MHFHVISMSSIIGSHNLVTQLEYFGLTKTDAKIYLTILKTGPITAREISKILEMHRGLVYQSITNLKNFSMIQTTFSNPIKCISEIPEVALKNLVEIKKQEYIISKKLSQNIIFELTESIKPVNLVRENILSIIQGKYKIFSKIENILDCAKKSIFIIAPIEDIIKFYYTSIPEKIQSCVKRGITVNVVTNYPTEKTFPIISKLGTRNIKYRKNLEKSRVILEEKSCILISNDSQNMVKNSNSDSALYTNAPDLVNNMTSFCIQIYNRSTQINQEQNNNFEKSQEIITIQ